MTINTKFNIKECVYIILGSKVKHVVVYDIEISVEDDTNTIISYLVIEDGAYDRRVDEGNMYKTKKEAVLEMVRQSGYEIFEDDLKEINELIKSKEEVNSLD